MQNTAIEPLSPSLVLPWSPNEEQEELFKKWSRNALIALILMMVAVPLLPVFESKAIPPTKKIIKTKVILKEKLKKIPPVKVKPKVVKKAKPKPKPKPKPKKAKAKPKQKKAKPKVAKAKKKKKVTRTASRNKKVTTKPVKKNAKATLKKSKAISALSSQLTALRGSVNIAGIRNKKATSRKRGVVATVDRGVLGENRAARASVGIRVEEGLVNSGGVKLAGHAVSNIVGLVSIGNSNGNSEYGDVSGQRNADNIRRTIEYKKGSIYSLYFDALNRYPDLSGKFIFKMMIKPNGKVSGLEVVSSELNLKALEEKILNRIASLNFGAKDVSMTPVEYRFVFVPS